MEFLSQFHPQIVHFPIVLLILSLAFDVVGRATDSTWWRKASLALLVIAVLGGVAGVLTGERVSEKAEERQGIPEAVVDAHGDMGKLATWFACGALAARLVENGLPSARTLVGVVALLLQLGSALAVGLAGYRGGKLVYEHGAGVTIDGKLIRAPGAKPEAGAQPAPATGETKPH
jgi:uncharacterized membrane protein